MGGFPGLPGRAQSLDRPTPAGGVARYFSILHNHFWRFLALGFMFLLFCLPIITIPAALCALNRVCILLARTGNCFLWSDFWEEFKESLWRAAPLGLLYGAGLALGYYFLSVGAASGKSLAAIGFFALGLALALYSAVAGSWTFALVAMQRLKNRELLRNARAMTVLEMPRGLLLALILAGFLAFILLLSPYSLIAAPFLLGFLQYTLCFIMNTAIERRIIAPFERQQNDEASDEE